MVKRQTFEISQSDVDEYQTIAPLLIQLHEDIQELTKKKQDGVLSKTRILMVNRLLERVRTLLKNDPSLGFLDLLDEDAVPQNADSMLITGQYVSALKNFKTRHTTEKDYNTVWICSGYPEVR